jgi:hypothetical protein
VVVDAGTGLSAVAAFATPALPKIRAPVTQMVAIVFRM